MDFDAAVPRIFLALILGGLVGLEREFTQKSAGLRTHLLVTLGATIFTLVSLSDFYYGLSSLPFSPEEDNRLVRDPSRVAAQIVTGIGFIGGGAVLRHGFAIRGLTTAASLWSMASIGMLVGIGQYRLAIVATILVFLVLFTIGKVERHFFRKNVRTFNRLKVHLALSTDDALVAQTWMESRYEGCIIETRTQSDVKRGLLEMDYVLNVEPGKARVNEVSRQINQLTGVRSSAIRAYYETEDLS